MPSLSNRNACTNTSTTALPCTLSLIPANGESPRIDSLIIIHPNPTHDESDPAVTKQREHEVKMAEQECEHESLGLRIGMYPIPYPRQCTRTDPHTGTAIVVVVMPAHCRSFSQKFVVLLVNSSS